MYQVTKRDGEIAAFDLSKISEAIKKAFEAKEREYNQDIIDLLALKVTADFEPKVAQGLVSVEDIQGGKLTGLSLTIRDYGKLAKELGIGEITLRDIVKELEKPGRDPRDEMPRPILRTDVLEMKDLTEGMILKGTVRNVIDFGVFVDIGVHQDGLVHISEITDKKFIKHPLEVVSVGDIVDVKVMSVDLKKKRIQLTMKGIS